MPITLARLPIRLAIGDHEPIEVGTFELEAGAIDNGTITMGKAALAKALRKAADVMAIDPALTAEAHYMVGDSNGEASLHCTGCDRGGLPIAHWSDRPYGHPDVVTVASIAELVEAARAHADHHAA